MATAERTAAPATYEGYEALFASIDAPFAFVDLDAMWTNALDMLRRASGKPIRVATKSLRCRPLIASALENDPGFQRADDVHARRDAVAVGDGLRDLLLAYPTADRQELARLAAIDEPGRPVIMVDSVEHLDFIESAAAGGAPTRVCIEIDLSFWTAGGRVKIGTKRSPIRTPEQAVALAREIERRPGVELVGLMGYEGHIAGVGDSPRERVRAEVIRRMRKSSVSDIRERRAAIVEAVSRVTPLAFVNGGGTGQPGADRGRGRRDRAGGRLGLLRPHALRPLLVVQAAPGRDVRAAGRAPAGARLGDPARRRLPGLGARRTTTACPRRTCRSGSSSTRWRAPARSRRPCTARPPTG